MKNEEIRWLRARHEDIESAELRLSSWISSFPIILGCSNRNVAWMKKETLICILPGHDYTSTTSDADFLVTGMPYKEYTTVVHREYY